MKIICRPCVVVVLLVLTLSKASAFLVLSTSTSTTATASSSSFSLAAAQKTIPFVSDCKVLRNGAIQGFVRNHPTISNGVVTATSPLADRNSPKYNQIVVTKTGSKYNLGKGKGGTVVNGWTVPKPVAAARSNRQHLRPNKKIPVLCFASQKILKDDLV
jgi:hypothetical protein